MQAGLNSRPGRYIHSNRHSVKERGKGTFFRPVLGIVCIVSTKYVAPYSVRSILFSHPWHCEKEDSLGVRSRKGRKKNSGVMDRGWCSPGLPRVWTMSLSGKKRGWLFFLGGGGWYSVHVLRAHSVISMYLIGLSKKGGGERSISVGGGWDNRAAVWCAWACFLVGEGWKIVGDEMHVEMLLYRFFILRIYYQDVGCGSCSC